MDDSFTSGRDYHYGTTIRVSFGIDKTSGNGQALLKTMSGLGFLGLNDLQDYGIGVNRKTG